MLRRAVAKDTGQSGDRRDNMQRGRSSQRWPHPMDGRRTEHPGQVRLGRGIMRQAEEAEAEIVGQDKERGPSEVVVQSSRGV